MEILSTYRLQFHKGFTFRDAIHVIPYLKDLGITHVYASPYLKAVAGSTHGYDVIDHSQLNPEVGSLEDYEAFLVCLKAHGMSHILDTVPNHMGVETNDNHWWNDVLTHGRDSAYSDYFDIDWEGFAPRAQAHGKVILAFLGETLDEAIHRGLLELKNDGGARFIEYRGRRFPVAPGSDLDSGWPELLDAQHYRLCSWKTAADEINYRRFFDISGLAGLQMQRQDVFDTAHKFTLQLIAEGNVAGLRVDHPDGLLEPKEYFQRLRAATGSEVPIWVEKILNGDEELCIDWPVDGTSGYDFLYAINDLFVDTKNESAMTEAYVNIAGDHTSYADWVYRNKCAVLDGAMHSEMCTLANRLDALAQAELSSRDFTLHQLHDALRAVIACFPVYRSYVSPQGVSAQDIALVQQAVQEAIRRNPQIELPALKFVQDSVLLRYPVKETNRARQLDFAMRFQQLTSPVNAKGIEDSTFYIFNRLVSLNEVGGDPGRFGRDAEAIHRYLAVRQKHWPRALSVLSTHDTKRSEDVRARLNVLSEIPGEWSEYVRRWRQINANLSRDIHPNDQYLLYQTMIGAWPLQPIDDGEKEVFIQRICAYMQKALREAKLRSSWTRPDQKYEAAVEQLIRNLIAGSSQEFLSDFLPFQKRVAFFGMINSLAQTSLRLTAPGVSDTYQGTELWDFSLVDPDNRRPVDYGIRQSVLEEFDKSENQQAMFRQLVETMEDGRIKLWVTRQLLRCRRAVPDLFLRGTYEPITVDGARAGNVFAFARRWESRSLIVVVPRLTTSLLSDGTWKSTDWGDTRIVLPSGIPSVTFENVLGEGSPAADGNEIGISELLGSFPIAVLVGRAS